MTELERLRIIAEELYQALLECSNSVDPRSPAGKSLALACARYREYLKELKSRVE